MKTLILVLTATLIAMSAAGRAQNQPAPPDQQSKIAGHQPVMASMQAADKTLDDLVAQLNAARGDDRLDKVIAVVKALVAERKAMRSMMSGPGGMMMMNKEAAAPSTDDDHSTHHPERGK